MSASSYVVLLKESHGRRLVPIMVGENEAMAIQYNHFKSTAISHPSIYNVMLDILERNQLHITQVQISEFKEGNFFYPCGRWTGDGHLCQCPYLHGLRIGKKIWLYLPRERGFH